MANAVSIVRQAATHAARGLHPGTTRTIPVHFAFPTADFTANQRSRILLKYASLN
jgi:hypothetical protein